MAIIDYPAGLGMASIVAAPERPRGPHVRRSAFTGKPHVSYGGRRRWRGTLVTPISARNGDSQLAITELVQQLFDPSNQLRIQRPGVVPMIDVTGDRIQGVGPVTGVANLGTAMLHEIGGVVAGHWDRGTWDGAAPANIDDLHVWWDYNGRAGTEDPFIRSRGLSVASALKQIDFMDDEADSGFQSVIKIRGRNVASLGPLRIWVYTNPLEQAAPVVLNVLEITPAALNVNSVLPATSFNINNRWIRFGANYDGILQWPDSSTNVQTARTTDLRIRNALTGVLLHTEPNIGTSYDYDTQGTSDTDFLGYMRMDWADVGDADDVGAILSQLVRATRNAMGQLTALTSQTLEVDPIAPLGATVAVVGDAVTIDLVAARPDLPVWRWRTVALDGTAGAWINSVDLDNGVPAQLIFNKPSAFTDGWVVVEGGTWEDWSPAILIYFRAGDAPVVHELESAPRRTSEPIADSADWVPIEVELSQTAGGEVYADLYWSPLAVSLAPDYEYSLDGGAWTLAPAAAPARVGPVTAAEHVIRMRPRLGSGGRGSPSGVRFDAANIPPPPPPPLTVTPGYDMVVQPTAIRPPQRNDRGIWEGWRIDFVEVSLDDRVDDDPVAPADVPDVAPMPPMMPAGPIYDIQGMILTMTVPPPDPDTVDRIEFSMNWNFAPLENHPELDTIITNDNWATYADDSTHFPIAADHQYVWDDGDLDDGGYAFIIWARYRNQDGSYQDPFKVAEFYVSS